MERLEVRKHLKDFWRCSTALALVILLGGGLVLEEWSRRPRVLATGPYELTLIAACGSQLIDPPESGIGFVTKGGGGYTVSVRVNESLLKEAAEAIGFKRGRIDVYDNLYRVLNEIPGKYPFEAVAEAFSVSEDGRTWNFEPLGRISGTLYCPSQILAGLPKWVGKR